MPQLKIRKNFNLNVEILNSECTETIVLVHGMFGNLSQFYLTIAPFLAQKFRVVMFDLKSHGRSNSTETGYDLISHATDLRELFDALEIQQAHLLGFSYGSLIALKFAMLFPKRTKKLVAIEVPDKQSFPYKKKGEYTFDDFWGFVVYLNTNIRENFFRSNRQIQNTFRIYQHIFNETSFSADMSQEKEFFEEDYSSLSTAVLLCYGDQSPCIGEYHRIKQWIPNVDSFIDAGDHGFFMDNAEVFSLRVFNFILGCDEIPMPSQVRLKSCASE